MNSGPSCAPIADESACRCESKSLQAFFHYQSLQPPSPGSKIVNTSFLLFRCSDNFKKLSNKKRNPGEVERHEPKQMFLES